MLCHKHKFIFIHNRKTGGTSIEAVFKPDVGGPHEGNRGVEHKHASAIQMKEKFPKEWLEYFKFTLVRNPYDLLVSRYHWSRDLQKIDWYKNHTFKEFVICINKNTVRPEWTKPTSQYNSLCIDQKLDIDFIARFENLQQDFNTICDKIGIPRQQLPHKNKTKHKHYTEYYDDETKEIVAEKYAKDIEYFGYEFGDKK